MEEDLILKLKQTRSENREDSLIPIKLRTGRYIRNQF